ncbi:hypothetical protein ACLOJK_010108 [Asimina triloba]
MPSQTLAFFSSLGNRFHFPRSLLSLEIVAGKATSLPAFSTSTTLPLPLPFPLPHCHSFNLQWENEAAALSGNTSMRYFGGFSCRGSVSSPLLGAPSALTSSSAKNSLFFREMAEGGKVRVVRCPKCEKLLPELPDYPKIENDKFICLLHVSVRAMAARNQIPVAAEVSLEGEVVRILENSESFSEKGGMVSNGGVSETKKEGGMAEFKGKETVLLDRLTNVEGGSSSRTENGEGFCDRANRYRRASKAPIDSDFDELIRINADENWETEVPEENANGFRKSRQMPECRTTDRSGPYRRTPRAVSEGMRFSPYPGEGPSSYRGSFDFDYREPVKRPNTDGPRRVEHLEEDRAKLLRKLDELREQLIRSCDVSEEQRENAPPAIRKTVPMSSNDGRDPWFAEGLATSNGTSSQLFPPDERRPHFSSEDATLMNHHAAAMNSYPPVHLDNDVLGCRDLFAPQMLGKAPRQPCQYSQRHVNGYLSGHYMGINSDPFIPYARGAYYNQPPCSCLHCYDKHWQVPAQVPPAVLCNRRLQNDSRNQMFYHTDDPGILGRGRYSSGGANAPFRSHGPLGRVRRPSNLESEMGVFGRSCVQRAVIAKPNQRNCLPIAGGAPFITCYSCFELLQLPKNLLSLEKSQHTLRCGACSKVITFEVDGRRLFISVPAHTKNKVSDVDNDSGDLVRRGLYSLMDQGTSGSYSGDYENTGYSNQSPDTKPMLSSAMPDAGDSVVGKECTMNLSGSEKMQGLSSSSCSLEDEESPDSMVSQRNGTRSTELPLKLDMTSPTSRAPLREHFGCSPDNPVVTKFQKESRSKRSDQATKGTSRQNSLKDASVPTEMDCSYGECPNSVTTKDFEETRKEEDRPRVSKGGESFFAGLIKKSFKDFGKSNQDNAKANVSINGLPIPDRLIKKAEKLAGPIHPGNYWYDYQAGFWGVMGHECLGIIPPFVEEFNHPMPKNCSGGDTGVLVNGRELHQKDLDLLANRGLPVTRDKSYIVDISGRVLDASSGEELDCLGKLAPTWAAANFKEPKVTVSSSLPLSAQLNPLNVRVCCFGSRYRLKKQLCLSTLNDYRHVALAHLVVARAPFYPDEDETSSHIARSI